MAIPAIVSYNTSYQNLQLLILQLSFHPKAKNEKPNTKYKKKNRSHKPGQQTINAQIAIAAIISARPIFRLSHPHGKHFIQYRKMRKRKNAALIRDSKNKPMK